MSGQCGRVVTLAIVAAGVARFGTLRANELPGLSVVATPGGGAGSTDVTANVEVLGEPFKGRWFGRWTYARNVWDMQVYDGRIYLGCGNSSNEGPATNTGPVPVICFDPRRSEFVCEATLLEEQIDRYCVTDGRSVNDHQWVPLGLFAAASLNEVRHLDVPGMPYDLLVRDNVCYVLSCRPPDEPRTVRWTVAVYASSDLDTWHEVLRFEAPTFARSFETLDGDFYFGLGTDTDHVAPETGRILRVQSGQR